MNIHIKKGLLGNRRSEALYSNFCQEEGLNQKMKDQYYTQNLYKYKWKKRKEQYGAVIG